MAANYDFANGTAIVQRWSHANAEHRSAAAQLRRAFWPGAKDEAANRESHKWLAHVDQDEWPGICFKSGEQGDRRMFNKQKREPAKQRDFQTGDCIRRVQPHDQPRQRVVDDNCREDCKHVGADVMRALDIGHRSGVQIEPFLAEDGVPSPADELVHQDQDPNGDVIDLRVHKTSPNYRGVGSWIARRSRPLFVSFRV